jgi:hypothetical protein
MISIYKSVQQTFDKNYITVETAIERIKNSRYRDRILKMRTLSKDEYTIEKNKLPVYRWSGVFEYGNDAGIKTHSGLICLDFDKYPNDEVMADHRSKLCADPYTYILFTSPSGKGLKVVVKITDVIENHRKHFLSLKQHFDSEYWDNSSINISRNCFDSYDPDIYVNNNSEIYLSIIEEVEDIDVTYVATIPMRSTNKIIQNIQKWFDSKYQLSEGNRNNSFFNLASAFNRYGIQQSECEPYILNNYIDVLGRDELLQCIKSGYRDKGAFGTSQFEDKEIINYVKNELKQGEKPKTIKSKLKEYSEDEVEIIMDKAESELKNFWRKNDKGRVTLSPTLYRDFLAENGFFKYQNSELSYLFVKVENNFVKEINEDLIKDFVLDHVEKQGDHVVFDFMASVTKYFKRDFLSYMKAKDVDFIRDVKDKAYLFYKNCLVEITAKSVEEKQYVDFIQHVWDKQVIDRVYKKSSSKCDFQQFIFNISKTQDRYDSFRSVIGYMLHTYKNPYYSPAIILNDEDISDNPQGGTGKGIITEALSKFKNTCTINGKNFDPSKDFAFQRVSLDTQILIFDDVNENFDFEKLFSIVTDGMPVNKKNKDEFFIEKDRTPKIAIPTNYVLKGEGNSHERRKFEIELHNHYDKTFTPFHDFGRNLFYDWDDQEWSKFDNFMIECIQYYLKNGIVNYASVNLDEKRLMSEIGHDFYSWINDNMKFNERMILKDMFEKFCDQYPTYRKFSQKYTSGRIRKYGDYLVKKGKLTRVDAGKQNGSIPYIEYVTEQKKESEWDNLQIIDKAPF